MKIAYRFRLVVFWRGGVLVAAYAIYREGKRIKIQKLYVDPNLTQEDKVWLMGLVEEEAEREEE